MSLAGAPRLTPTMARAKAHRRAERERVSLPNERQCEIARQRALAKRNRK